MDSFPSTSSRSLMDILPTTDDSDCSRKAAMQALDADTHRTFQRLDELAQASDGCSRALSMLKKMGFKGKIGNKNARDFEPVAAKPHAPIGEATKAAEAMRVHRANAALGHSAARGMGGVPQVLQQQQQQQKQHQQPQPQIDPFDDQGHSQSGWRGKRARRGDAESGAIDVKWAYQEPKRSARLPFGPQPHGSGSGVGGAGGDANGRGSSVFDDEFGRPTARKGARAAVRHAAADVREARLERQRAAGVAIDSIALEADRARIARETALRDLVTSRVEDVLQASSAAFVAANVAHDDRRAMEGESPNLAEENISVSTIARHELQSLASSLAMALNTRAKDLPTAETLNGPMDDVAGDDDGVVNSGETLASIGMLERVSKVVKDLLRRALATWDPLGDDDGVAGAGVDVGDGTVCHGGGGGVDRTSVAETKGVNVLMELLQPWVNLIDGPTGDAIDALFASPKRDHRSNHTDHIDHRDDVSLSDWDAADWPRPLSAESYERSFADDTVQIPTGFAMVMDGVVVPKVVAVLQRDSVFTSSASPAQQRCALKLVATTGLLSAPRSRQRIANCVARALGTAVGSLQLELSHNDAMGGLAWLLPWANWMKNAEIAGGAGVGRRVERCIAEAVSKYQIEIDLSDGDDSALFSLPRVLVGGAERGLCAMAPSMLDVVGTCIPQRLQDAVATVKVQPPDKDTDTDTESTGMTGGVPNQRVANDPDIDAGWVDLWRARGLCQLVELWAPLLPVGAVDDIVVESGLLRRWFRTLHRGVTQSDPDFHRLHALFTAFVALMRPLSEYTPSVGKAMVKALDVINAALDDTHPPTLSRNVSLASTIDETNPTPTPVKGGGGGGGSVCGTPRAVGTPTNARHHPLVQPHSDAVIDSLADAAASRGVDFLPWDKAPLSGTNGRRLWRLGNACVYIETGVVYARSKGEWRPMSALRAMDLATRQTNTRG